MNLKGIQDALGKLKRTKLWAMFGGGSSGMVIVEEGLNMTGAHPAVQIMTIASGALLVGASVVAYILTEGSIDKIRAKMQGVIGMEEARK